MSGNGAVDIILLQNRVDPWGTIIRTPARGAFMGNRGLLHNRRQEIVRPYRLKCWITCLLEFKGRGRKVMSPGLYTELFFLDEAVAFAAGHRPCAECRRARFNAFLDAWKRATGRDPALPLRVAEIDAELHRARIDASGAKVTCEAQLDSLPDGCFIEIDGLGYLVWNNGLWLWSPEGYLKHDPKPHGRTVTLLTPAPSVECFRQGYKPEVHPSAR